MFTEEEFCRRVGIELGTLRLWLDEGWLAPQRDEAGVVMSDVDEARARLIRDLRHGIGVNDEGIDVILDLVDQVHGLRSMLQRLLEHLGSADRSRGAYHREAWRRILQAWPPFLSDCQAGPLSRGVQRRRSAWLMRRGPDRPNPAIHD